MPKSYNKIMKEIVPFYNTKLSDINRKKWDLTDTHVHTINSIVKEPVIGMRYQDSLIRPKELLKKADKLGFKELVITDHDAPRRNGKLFNNYSPLKGTFKIQKMAKDFKVKIIPGQEVTFEPNDGSVKAAHIVVFPIQEEIPLKHKTGTLDEFKDYCLDNSILIRSLAHPFSDDNRLFRSNMLFDMDKKKFHVNRIIRNFTAIECINGYSFEELVQSVILSSKKINLAKIGGSDAHTLSAFGKTGTLVPKGMGLVEAIRKKKTQPFGTGMTEDIVLEWSKRIFIQTQENINTLLGLKKTVEPPFKVFEQIHGDRSKAIVWFFKFLMPLLKIYADYIDDKLIVKYHNEAIKYRDVILKYAG